MDTTTIFCASDEFCKEFELRWEQRLLESSLKRRRQQEALCLRNCLEIMSSGLMERLFAISRQYDESTKKRKKRYPSNLSEGALRYLKPHLPVSAVGRPRELSMRQVVL